jgi:hypothetical protein
MLSESKVEQITKFWIFHYPENAVFRSFVSLNASNRKIFLLICIGQTIWNRSMYSLWNFRSIFICYHAQTTCVLAYFSHILPYFEIFMNTFPLLCNLLMLKSLLVYYASSLCVYWLYYFDIRPYTLEIISGEGVVGKLQRNFRISAKNTSF